MGQPAGASGLTTPAGRRYLDQGHAPEIVGLRAGSESEATLGVRRSSSPGGARPAASGMAILQSKTLVLNRSFLPVHITTVRRACILVYQGVARVVDDRFQVFDLEGWCARGVEAGQEALGLVSRSMAVPRVVVLLGYDRLPRRSVRFTRQNVYARDRHTCQYCGRRLPRHELNLDHVVPRSQGGQSTWENIVCSCHVCNRRKGGRTPEQAGVRLLRRPTRPAWSPFLAHAAVTRRYHDWQVFLGPGFEEEPLNATGCGVP